MKGCIWLVPWALALLVGGNACCEPGTGGAPVSSLTAGTGASIHVELDIPTYVTAERVDVRIDWGSLDADLYCEALDPAEEIDMVGLVRSGNLSPDEFASGLAGNAMGQSDIDGYVDCHPTEGTSCWLSEFSFFGTALNVAQEYADDGSTYLLQFSEGIEPGRGVRSWAFLEPDPDSGDRSG